MIAVVDTNVPVVANGKSPQASSECVLACVKSLNDITRWGKLVLDDRWLIVGEYQNNLHSTGQPGVGDAFLKWVLTNLKNPLRCEIVIIKPTNRDNTDFAEFPNDPNLKDFDPSDRIFIAVSRSHPNRPPILQAVDQKWWRFKNILLSHGVKVDFLCKNDL